MGEYAALYASGINSLETSFSLVKKRIQAIESVTDLKGCMSVLIGVTERKLCELAGGNVWPANYSTYDQITVSGDKEGIDSLENWQKLKI